jgi:hypothetical protein
MRWPALLTAAVPFVLMFGTVVANAAPRYVDLETYSPETDRFWEVGWELLSDYQQACLNGRCHGAYADHRPLQLRCSVDTETGDVAECRWLFAAVNITVDPATGVTHAAATVNDCVLPLTPGTSAIALVNALAVPDPLEARLPGGADRMWDARTACLGGGRA